MVNILEIKNLNKKYKQNNNEILILDDINFAIKEGEIIGIIGRSGSGKSTLLRIIADLIKQSEGEVLYNNEKSAPLNLSMVFQSFGLIPWLNIHNNVALGLSNQNLSKKVINQKVIEAMNLVGLRGYASAYPKEISGGMRQRVGFARALVVEPEILLMDEPFSALDYLTANNLKSDLLDFWFKRSMSSIKAMILVTHNIAEAASLCDRVLVLSSNPGRIIANIEIDMEHPRDPESQKFHATLDKLYLAMTNNPSENNRNIQKSYPQKTSVMSLLHFMLTIKRNSGANSCDIRVITDELQLTNDQLMMIIESLTLLKFIEIEDNNLRLSSSGQILMDADDKSQKVIFKEHLVKYVTFISEIYHTLLDNESAIITKSELFEILAKKFTNDQANQILTATISWSRYAELFIYDAASDGFMLKPCEKAVT